jgi:hypothetical protein
LNWKNNFSDAMPDTALRLALTLFVTRIAAADDANDAIAANNLAVAADLFDGSSDFHDLFSNT